MGFKDEFKREMRNVIRDAEKEVDKTWTIEYNGHEIKIINKIKKEQLIIDGIIVDENKRKSLFSHIIPYSTLSGSLQRIDGTQQKVFVRLGGFTKLNCTVKVEKETIFDDSLKLEFLPWEHKEKLLPFIQQQVQKHNQILDDVLPDEEYLFDQNHPRLAAGESDQFADAIPTPFFAKGLLKSFEEQMNEPTDKTRKATYEKIISDQIASYGAEFIERFQQTQFDETLVQQEALWLLEHAAHREVVKFAITVLGLTNCEKYKELLFTLGLHEEFTTYVIFAFKNGTSNSNGEIWELAKSLHGWGKIAAVEQLDATSAEIKQWLLIDGCQNTIMNEYLAYPCAVKGELDSALEEENISKELYDAAGLIIEALLSTKAHQNIDDYPYAYTVLSRFIYHARAHCQTLTDFYPLVKISQFLNDDAEVWEERFDHDWKQFQVDHIQELIQPFIEDSKWSQLAVDVLQQDYNYKALEIARFYQVDVTSDLFMLLKKHPTNSELYWAIMDTNNRQHIKDLCTFAENHLSLSNLSSEEQDCLEYIVQDLHEYEGVGLSLIQASLHSENGILQYQALSVLEAWSTAIWKQPSILNAIRTIATKSKDKEDRRLAKQLLAK